MVFVIRVYHEKLSHMLKPLVPEFRPDLSARLKYIAEKQVPGKLKPIVDKGFIDGASTKQRRRSRARVNIRMLLLRVCHQNGALGACSQ